MARVVVPLASGTAGVCWLVALFLPWTSAGALSSASLLDAVELIRRGSVDAVVPSWAAVVLLVPCVAGIVLVGAVGFHGRTTNALRLLALGLGSLGALGIGWRLAGLDVTAVGPGAWVALGGVLVGTLAATSAFSALLRH
ncbi:hypothetical protein [Nocardioides pelophilus]|uniref:hypothetical protein n=1 Tax=Nocardioides pelophilus TaxID=2172019 RepID=UPI0016003652|nr:hypothetical protein [Nocardioides pelophilus]